MKNLFFVILLLYTKLMLLYHVCCCNFKYLPDGYMRNTYTIWQQNFFYTDENTDGLQTTIRYTNKLSLLVYYREY
jgi:hypothetical protein